MQAIRFETETPSRLEYPGEYAGLTVLLAQSASCAMPGMDIGANAQAPSLAKSIGAPINSDAAEFETIFNADAKTVLFVSTRPGSIESPGNPYSFDVWMAYGGVCRVVRLLC